jgi:hypothetical protein
MTAREGYVLPLALVAIAVIAIVSAAAAEQVQRASRSIGQLADRSRLETDIISAEQTLLYLLLTEPTGAQGIEVGGTPDIFGLGTAPAAGVELVHADGTPRSFGDPPVIVRLVDDQAFLNFTAREDATQTRTLTLFGISEPRARRLAAALADYQDEDDLRRLGGAEARDYPSSRPPANQPLRNVLEVCSVLGWAETEVCSDTGRLLLVGRVRSSDNLNPVLPSVPLLELLLDDVGEARETHRAMQMREIASFGAIGYPDFDIDNDPLSGRGYPGPTFVLITHPPEGTPVRRTVIELNPSSTIAPFFLHSKYAIGGTYAGGILAVEDVQSVEGVPEPAANARSGGRSN